MVFCASFARPLPPWRETGYARPNFSWCRVGSPVTSTGASVIWEAAAQPSAASGYQSRVCIPETRLKCWSLVTSGRSYSRARAAIQMSLSGMGVPAWASLALIWP